jgi:hypothetical protein
VEQGFVQFAIDFLAFPHRPFLLLFLQVVPRGLVGDFVAVVDDDLVFLDLVEGAEKESMAARGEVWCACGCGTVR